MQLPHFTRLCVVALLLAVGCAEARDRRNVESSPSFGDAREVRVAQSGMSLDQAVSMVEKRYKARVVRTEVKTEGDRKIYVLRLLNDAGRVWTVRVDASSG